MLFVKVIGFVVGGGYLFVIVVVFVLLEMCGKLFVDDLVIVL